MSQTEQQSSELVTVAGTDPADEVAAAPAEGSLHGLPLSLAPARGGLWRNDAASLAVAFVLHAGALAALMYTSGDSMVGGGGGELDAINIEVISRSEVLEALAIDPTAQAPAGAIPTAVASLAAPARSTPVDQSKAGHAEDAAADETAPELDGTDQDERIEEAKPEDARENVAASETAAAARGTGRSGMASALAAAPPGLEREYAKTVLFALARNKPRISVSTRGIVKIGFTVSVSGEVGSVRVAESSGNPRLDDAALAAVRSTRFPAPPRELGGGSLAYEIPYIFR